MRAIWLGLLVLTAGCRLIDQTTFNPDAGKSPFPVTPAMVPTAPPTGGPPALLVIRFDQPNPDYTDALTVAVTRARERKPDVQFDVVTVVPAEGSPRQQIEAASVASSAGRDVARAIAELGVPDGNIQLAARAEPGVSVRQVRIFVR